MTESRTPRWDWAEPHSKPFIGDNGYPIRGHPTVYRCDVVLKSGVQCPSYLNHDGNGYLYCPNQVDHSDWTDPLDRAVEKVEQYQQSGFVHPYTCGNPDHDWRETDGWTTLKPEKRGGDVWLVCPCSYEQRLTARDGMTIEAINAAGSPLEKLHAEAQRADRHTFCCPGCDHSYCELYNGTGDGKCWELWHSKVRNSPYCDEPARHDGWHRDRGAGMVWPRASRAVTGDAVRFLAAYRRIPNAFHEIVLRDDGLVECTLRGFENAVLFNGLGVSSDD